MIIRPIPGIPGFEISDTGRVFRRIVGLNGARPMEVRPWVNAGTGYWCVTINAHAESRGHSVHRLLAITFLGAPPSPKHQVAHSDGDRTNNALSNLRWVTPRENQADSYRHGTRRLGTRSPNAKITEDSVRAIRSAFADGEKQRDIASRFGIHQAQVHRICARKSWAHVDNPQFLNEVVQRAQALAREAA